MSAMSSAETLRGLASMRRAVGSGPVQLSLGKEAADKLAAACIEGADAIEARAAVAELIEAAKEMRQEASRLRGDCIPFDTLVYFDAALARVQGGAA